MIRPLVAALFLVVGAGRALAGEAAAPPAAPPSTPATPAIPATPATPAQNPEKPVPPKAPKKTPELLEAGKKVYEVNCLPCHGEKGDGNGPVGQALVPKPRDFAKDPFKQGTKPDEVFTSITTGVKDTAMVGYPQLSEDERWGLVYHVLEMVPKKGKDTKAKAKKDAPAAP